MFIEMGQEIEEEYEEEQAHLHHEIEEERLEDEKSISKLSNSTSRYKRGRVSSKDDLSASNTPHAKQESKKMIK